MFCQQEPHYASAGHFRAGACLPYPNRTLDTHVLLWGLAGEYDIILHNTVYTLKQDDLLLLPAGIAHGGNRPCTRDAEHLWCHFHLDTLPDFPALWHPSRPEKLRILFRQLVDSDCDASLPEDTRRVISNCFLRIILEEASSGLQSETAGTASPLFYKLADWIRLHADEGISVCDVAAAFGYNSNYLTSLFRKQAGMPLVQYINRQKIENAKIRLINTTHSVREIAFLSGFHEEKHFMKQFRAITGQTPTSFRRAICHTRINSR